MSKKIFYGVAVFIVAAMAAWNVNFSSKTKGMSDVSLANVEALAQMEHTWFEDRIDRYDPVRRCYYQCIDPGTGCMYVYNYAYGCSLTPTEGVLLLNTLSFLKPIK